MKIQSEKLIDELIKTTRQHIEFVQKLKEKSDAELNFRNSDNSWNALECLEHLNLYGKFYLPEIERRINGSKTQAQMYFSSGLLGNYFANSMLPKEKLNKMKTFNEMNPIYLDLNRSVLDVFLNQQNIMLQLLERARKVDLGKVKTSISITNLIKLKLGDTFRFVINHNTRHIEQIKRIGY